MTELLNIDCMEYMKGLPDKYFDIAIVDPEYGIGEDGKKSHSRKGIAKAKKYSIKAWDNKRPDKKYFDEVFRVSKHQIIWGYNYFSDLLPPTNSVIVWDKKCHDKYSTDMSDAEVAWCSIGNRTAVFRFLWSGMMQGNPNNGTSFIGDLSLKEERIHPTQKPKALYKWIFKNYCKDGFKILDTHLGSMSSAIVAEKLGFDFVGCEIDKEYFDNGKARFNKETDCGMFNV